MAAVRRIKPIFIFSLFVFVLAHSVAVAKLIETPFEYKVFGWTNDSKLWSFSEEGDYGCGMVYSPMVGFYVIDAAKNNFSYKFNKSKVSEEDDNTKADNQIRAWKTQNLKMIQNMGFSGNMGLVLYSKQKGSWQDTDSTMKQYGEKSVTFKLGQDEYTVKLEDHHKDSASSFWGKKSKFTISIRKNNEPWQTLQEDDNYNRDFLLYKIIYISLSPDKKKIALLVEAIEHGLEGTKNSHFKGVTGYLPTGQTE